MSESQRERNKSELSPGTEGTIPYGGIVLPENYSIPSFARDFPNDEALDNLVRAFIFGNYAHVRAEAPELAARTPDPAVRDAANRLYEALQPDPLAKIMLLAAAVLVVVMTAWWMTHDAGVS